MAFGASCGSALAVVPASVLGALRLSKVLLGAVYCVAGCGGAFPRKRSSTLLLPEQLASTAPKMETTRMRIMTLSRGSRSIMFGVFRAARVRSPAYLRPHPVSGTLQARPRLCRDCLSASALQEAAEAARTAAPIVLFITWLYRRCPRILDAITIVTVRTHVSLGKDAPCRRPSERFGDIVSYPILDPC